MDWAALPGAITYVSEATSQVIIDNPRPAQELMTAAQRSAQATVINLLSKPYRSRSLSFDFKARVTFQSGAAPDGTPTPHWRDQLPAVSEALLHRPDCVDYGVILARGAYGEGGLASGARKRPAPYVNDSLYVANRHMWTSYVAEPHALQLLTNDHLDRAHDLSNWEITEVTRNRYLVQARDLGAWWDQDEPPAEVLRDAQQDFGAMLMTYADLEADPHSWLPGRGRLPHHTSRRDLGTPG